MFPYTAKSVSTKEFLLAFTVMTFLLVSTNAIAAETDKLVEGTEWEISTVDDFVTLSLTGLITYGERQRFSFRKGQCDVVMHNFSTYTTEPVDFKPLIGKILPIEFNEETIGAKVQVVYPAMMGHILSFNLGGYSRGELLTHLMKTEKIKITFIDGQTHKASDYFDVPSNEWSIIGISEAFDKAYQVCSQ